MAVVHVGFSPSSAYKVHFVVKLAIIATAVAGNCSSRLLNRGIRFPSEAAFAKVEAWGGMLEPFPDVCGKATLPRNGRAF